MSTARRAHSSKPAAAGLLLGAQAATCWVIDILVKDPAAHYQ